MLCKIFAGGNACLLAYILLIRQAAAAAATDTCSVYDAVNGTPVSNYRTCYVYRDNYCPCKDNRDSLCYEWRSKFCSVRLQCFPSECSGFVGMNLTYECGFEGARLYKYQDGEYRYLNGRSVNYGLLLPEHAGLYECRNSNNRTLYAQNLTVNEEVRIGSVGSHCVRYDQDRERGCCSASTVWIFTREQLGYEFVVYSSPEDYLNVTVEQIEWLVDKETRSEVDLGLYVERHPSNPVIWRLFIKNFPYKITEDTPQVLFRTTASNSHSSYSFCQVILFEGQAPRIFIENASHPEDQNVTEGEEAVFHCTISHSISPTSDFCVLLTVSNSQHNMGVFDTCTTRFILPTPYNVTTGNCSYYQIEQKYIVRNGLSQTVMYTIRIPTTSTALNGSTVACSLHNGYLQWRRVAVLTVYPQLKNEKASTTAVAVVVPLVIALLALLGIVSLVSIVTVWRRKKSPLIGHDKIPLKTKDSCDSEATTPMDETKRLPCKSNGTDSEEPQEIAGTSEKTTTDSNQFSLV